MYTNYIIALNCGTFSIHIDQLTLKFNRIETSGLELNVRKVIPV